ncbi:MAG TPA: cyclic nucleotide-binding domain-containing protein [Spirochaetota bacterium]|nr:cyclic nucleotide-binding domain-containing protein [Spirochaetota bacterium]
MAKQIVFYQRSEKIIKAGTTEQRMYIILEGEVEISLSDGNNRIVVAKLRKGDFFGEISLFNNTPRSADAIAAGDVKLAYIDSVEELKAFLLKNPVFAAKMVHILAQRLAKTDEILIGKVSELNRLKVLKDV